MRHRAYECRVNWAQKLTQKLDQNIVRLLVSRRPTWISDGDESLIRLRAEFVLLPGFGPEA